MDEANGPPASSFHWTNDAPAELWHSTPVKKKQHASAASGDNSQPSVTASCNVDLAAKHWSKGSPHTHTNSLCSPGNKDTQSPPVCDLSSSTIQKQRRELQLLMSELKDRDTELNNMAAARRTQLSAWERDRQRVLSLEQRGLRLDDELQKRNDVIRVLTKRVWIVETREEEMRKELEETKQKLSELQDKQHNISVKCEDFEEKNESLNSTVLSLSSKVGSLQVREEELSSMLKLKDKDVSEASGHIAELTECLKEMEASLKEGRARENKLQREAEESKRRYRDAKLELSHIKEELQQQVSLSSSQREETIRLKQELQLLQRDVALAGEGECWRDDLLELTRSKQERTMSELRCLRQVCENQRSDLQLLQLNLESSREALRERSGQGLNSSQEEEGRCCCPAPSLRERNRTHSLDVSSSLPAAELQDRHYAEPREASFGHSIDGDDPLSSHSLQQLLHESRRLSFGTSDPTCTHKHPPDSHPIHPQHTHSHPPPHPHAHPLPQHSTPKKYQAVETPPNVCPRHCNAQTDIWTS